MATTEKYTTVIELNSEQAKRQLDELRKKVESWKSDLAEAREKKMGKSFIAAIRKELSAAEKELAKYDNEVARTIETLNNIGKASVEEIENAQKSLLRLSKEVPHDSGMYNSLTNMLDKVTQELENIKATKAFEQMQKEAEGATKSTAQVQAELAFIKQTADNAETASVKQLQLAERTAENIRNSSQKGSENWEKANNGLEKVRKRLREISSEEQKAAKAIDRYEEEVKKAAKTEEQLKKEAELVNRTIDNISTARVRDLEYSIKILNEKLRETERSGGNIEDITAKLKRLNEELKKVQDMQRPQDRKGGLLSRGWDWLNKNWGAMTQIIDTYSGIRDVVKGSVEAFAEMDQEMNNVRKYTGQTIEEVQAMNEELKKMDTRTAREQLNQLAGSAGRLGITGKEDIMDFVYAADQINLALGDDLGKGAVDQIGKLAMAFGEDDRMGLRGAMLSTGSAVNELAQHSAANAGYLVDFAARLSGVGVQAGLTQAQILGLGAAMDENMQKDEMAATAISQIITKMTTDSETFARIAGKNVEEFATLVKTDMNAALMQFFEAMNRKGGFAELAPLFEQMGLDGTRAIGVLSTLAAKIDDVRRHQQLGTDAYREHTSVEQEAAVQNNTYQARLEKTRKAFNDLRIELGEKMLPVANAAISTTGVMVKILGTVVKFVIDNKAALVALTAAMAGYAVAAKLQVFWTKASNAQFIVMMRNAKGFTGVTTAMGAAVTNVAGKLLTLKTVIGGVVGIIGYLVAKLVIFREAEKAVEGLTEANNAFNEALTGTRRSIEEDTQRLRNLIEANEDATEAVKELAEKYPQLVTEQMSAAEAYDVLIRNSKAYCEQMAYEKKALSMGSTIEDNNQKLAIYQRMLKEVTQQLKEQHPFYEQMLQMMTGREEYLNKDYIPNDLLDKAAMLATRIERLRHENELLGEELKTTNKEIESHKRFIENWNTVVDTISSTVDSLKKKIEPAIKPFREFVSIFSRLTTTSATVPGASAQGTPGYDTRKYWEQQLKDRRAQLKALREDSTSTAEAIEEAAKKVKEAESKMEAFTGHKEYVKAERDKDRERRERERKADDAAKAETERQLAELTHRYAMGQILYCDYLDEQERIQLEGIERRMLIYSTESLEYQKLARKREELLLNGSEETQKLTAAQLRIGHEQRVAMLEEQARRENMTEQQKNEMLFREDMRYMDEQRILYRKGTLERINLESEISEKDQQHKLQREQYYRQQLQQVREQYLNMSNERRQEIALKGLEELHSKQLISEREYQEAKLVLQAQYANYETSSEHDQRVSSNALKVASDKAKQKIDGKNPKTLSMPIVGDITLYQSTMEQLKEMYQSDELTHAQYLAAKQQATAQFCESLAAQMQAAYNTVNQVMSAASSYFSAQQEYETAQVQRKYEKEIEAAGSNHKKVKKLQEQQQKEEAAIKTKYAKRAATIQMAQAKATTAMNAIQAYGAVLQPANPASYVYASFAAAAAIAAGMLQIATIKKQQQAQETGYYEGGFTGGRQYRKEAGVVHEGEFVANHQAVQNPAILPFLNFLDQAQRNNTVGSLTAADVSRSMGARSGASAPIITPIVNVQTDNEQLREAVEAHREATELLLLRLHKPINAQVVLTGPDGLNAQQQLLNSMLNNK